jgi:uncharacterized membrane protein
MSSTRRPGPYLQTLIVVDAPREGATMTNATTRSTFKQEDASLGRPAAVTAWVLAVVLALAMAGAGLAKLGGDAAMVEMFDDIGAGQWLRWMVGGLELAGAVGLLVPRLRAWAALGLLVLLVCATVANLAVLQTDTTASVALAALALVVLMLRRGELRLAP